MYIYVYISVCVNIHVHVLQLLCFHPRSYLASARRNLGGLIWGEQLLCYDIREDFYCFEPLSSVAIVALAYRFFLSLSLFQHLFHL